MKIYDPPVATRADRSGKALSLQVSDHVRAMIVSGALQEGAFVRLDAMAAELDMSLTPVREGMTTLASEGFLSLVPRRGFCVQPLTPSDITDLYFVQATIAGELAARAVRTMTDADVERMRMLRIELEQAIRDDDDDLIVRLDHQLHRVVNLAGDSPKLTWMLEMTLRYVPTRYYGSIEGWRQVSSELHREMVDALERRDSRAARRAMTNHIIHAGELLAAHRARLQLDRDDAPQRIRDLGVAGEPD